MKPPTIALRSQSLGYLEVFIVEKGSCADGTSPASYDVTYGPPSMEKKVNVPARESLATSGVGIPLEQYGENKLWFTGVCGGQEYTALSNVVSAVFSEPPRAPGRCTTAVKAPGTKWVFSCGTQSCDTACGSFGLTCNQIGNRQVVTKAQGEFLARLNNLPVTQYIDISNGYAPQADGPVIDYYGPSRSEYYYVGTSSPC